MNQAAALWTDLLTHLPWNPITFHVVLASFQLFAILLLGYLSAEELTIHEFVLAMGGIALLTAIGFYTATLGIVAFIIFLSLYVMFSTLLTKRNPVLSTMAFLIMLALLWASGTYLVAPFTPLRIQEIGGAPQFIQDFFTSGVDLFR